jgi:hypothetical protein
MLFHRPTLIKSEMRHSTRLLWLRPSDDEFMCSGPVIIYPEIHQATLRTLIGELSGGR